MPRRIEMMPLDALVGAVRNPKGHASEGIAASIERVGFIDGLVLDERTGRLVGGHGRMDSLAARAAAGGTPPEGIEVDASGAWLVPVQRGWASKDDADAEFALVALNQITIAGGWDDRGLSEILGPMMASGGIESLLGTGFTSDIVAEILARVAEQDRPEPIVDPDDVPEPPAVPVTKPGDLWHMGGHTVCPACSKKNPVGA